MVNSRKTNLLYSAAMDPQRMMMLLVLIVSLCLSYSNGNSDLEAPKDPAVDIQSEGMIQNFNFFFH